MRFIVQALLLILICFGPHSSVLGQGVVVKKSKNKVVVRGVKYFLHVVKEKETLFAISKEYGVDVAEIMQINSKKSAAVSIDEVLRIPEVKHVKAIAPRIIPKKSESTVFHEVKAGETLYSLARKYNVSQEEIVALNPGADLSLSLGSVIRIPQKGERKSASNVQQEKQPKVEGNFYFHVIGEGDTEYSICRKYGLKLRKFRKLNPQVKEAGLQVGAFVRIPKKLAPQLATQAEVVSKEVVDTVEKDSLPVSDLPLEVEAPALSKEKISMALMLPLYLEANDTINWIRNYEDTLAVVKERENKIIYSRSQDFIRFYQGVLLAVDTLKKQGLEIDLHVYDTERKKEKVKQILSSAELEEVDIIIGPVYSNTFNIAADYALERHIPIVSPLSAKNPRLNTNPFVFQLNTGISSLCDKVAKYVTKDISTTNLVVVHPKQYKHLNEYKLIRDVEKELFENGKYWSDQEIHYKKISFDDYGLYGIENTLCDSCENIILLPSTNQPVVDNIVTQLNVLSSRYLIRLVGFPVWKRYRSMDPENFYNLNTTLLSPYYVDYSSVEVDHFVSSFRKSFSVEPNDFSFRAYDLCLYFASAISRYGNTFMDYLDAVQPNLLQSKFQFERVGNFGGFENRGLYRINYGKDFQIHHSDFVSPDTLQEKASPYMD
jgi:LysM repeat protein